MLILYHNQKSASEEVLEPKLHRHLGRMRPLCTSKTVSLVRIGHELEFFAEVNELVDQGLISKNEKGRFIRNAARCK